MTQTTFTPNASIAAISTPSAPSASSAAVIDRSAARTVDPVVRLSRTVAGRIYRPGEHGYDVERRPLHPAFDPAPALVAVASGPTDIRAAVEFAREQDLPVAVQSTGHGTHAPADGALLIKTGRMAGVFVDAERRTARVGPGARWADVIAAAAPYGLAPLSGSAPSVGVTGYTTGGGLSWLSRRYGFAADSVLRADVVTADGRLVTATPDHYADLFWAIRGGGGNVGIVTSLEFQLYPVAEVYAGTSYFPADRAADVLTHYRDWVHTLPDELSTAVVLTPMPDAPEIPEHLRGRRAVAVKVMYAGDTDRTAATAPGHTIAPAEQALRSLRKVAGPALVDGFRRSTYAAASMGGTPPMALELFERLPDAVVRAVTDTAAESSGPAIEIRHWGGAMAHPGAGAGPVGHRDTVFSVIVGGHRRDLADTLRTHATGGSFLNFLGDTGRTATAYRSDVLRRLGVVKRAYDPDNTFRIGHTIAPAPRRR